MTEVLPEPLFESRLTGLERLHRGKVRDIYRVDDGHLLIVASDRLSAFDVVLPDPIPGKGAVLTAVANFWFARLGSIVANHLTGIDPESVLDDPSDRATVRGRAVVVRRARPLPVEAVVRGYLIGSGWKDYRATGQVCGIPLPPGMKIAERLAEPIFTPSTKAAQGEHDENIPMDAVKSLLGDELAGRIEALSLQLYAHASDYARQRGIILADTKFEFGLDDDGELLLIDEVFTPDSSRFWPATTYAPGRSTDSFDKQFVRDYLETLDWDKKPPGPHLPERVIRRTRDKYQEVLRRLTATD
ncbi:MAG: phosphoribosylaminoimidazolesuccinocarboxamide synthase [Gammaproteobacteria bacterium]|nr:phosphoribosylaminoimidazolesuccinocarboxamide synthase [Gammaproteobacteria bacterium]